MTYNMSLPFQFQSFVYFIIWGENSALLLPNGSTFKSEYYKGHLLTEFSTFATKRTLFVRNFSIFEDQERGLEEPEASRPAGRFKPKTSPQGLLCLKYSSREWKLHFETK